MKSTIRRIIREEMDGLEWIKNVQSNQDIAQEIADETEVDDNKRKIYFPFSTPFPHSLSFSLPFFSSHCKKVYGLNDDDIKDIWKRYKKMVMDKINDHNNLNENDELKWIKDVQSNQDIAQKIADETIIDYDYKIYAPSLPKYPFPPFPPNKPIRSFHAYCEEQYGLNDDDIKDVWNRYKKLITDKINDYRENLFSTNAFNESPNINESNDLQWIKDIRSIKIDDCLKVSGNYTFSKDDEGEITHWLHRPWTYIVKDIKNNNLGDYLLLEIIYTDLPTNRRSTYLITKSLKEVIDAIERGYLKFCDNPKKRDEFQDEINSDLYPGNMGDEMSAPR